MTLSQHNLVRAYIKQYGSILPAKIPGTIYMGQMFGSETSKRCRELRRAGELYGKKEGKFERFYPKVKVEPENPVVQDTKQMSML